MTDSEIIALFFARSEDALTETDNAYGNYCRALTLGILGSREDSEECVNDTYLKLWEQIPPKRPPSLGAFAAKTARNLALNRRSALRAEKRGGGLSKVDYEEIKDCLPSSENVGRKAEEGELTKALERFLRALPKQKRLIFLKRYWGFMTFEQIARDMSLPESTVKTTLYRTRERLRGFLEKEGIEV